MALRDGEIKRTVLCFVFDKKNDLLLMIHKKRGQGAGKINVPGGKIQAGETEESAARRETIEETGIEPLTMKQAGKLEFYFPYSDSWDNTCTVFVADNFAGSLISESEECSAHWLPCATLPLDKMWDADRLWLPYLLAGKEFHRAYVFDSSDRVIEERALV